MTTTYKTKTVILCIVLLMLASCSKKPEFISIENISIIGSENDNLIVGMDYMVYNPNNVRTKLRQSSMEIYYKDSLVGNGFLNEEVILSANDTLKIPVTCKIDVKTLHTLYPEILATDSSKIDLKGNGRVS